MRLPRDFALQRLAIYDVIITKNCKKRIDLIIAIMTSS